MTIVFLQDIQNAFMEDTQASYQWAENRIKEIKHHLKLGKKINIINKSSIINITSLKQFQQWIEENNFTIPLNVEININQEIEKFNQIFKNGPFESLKINKEANTYSNKNNISLITFDNENRSIYACFKQVELSSIDFKEIRCLNKMELKLLENNDQFYNLILIIEQDNKVTKHQIICTDIEV